MRIEYRYSIEGKKKVISFLENYSIPYEIIEISNEYKIVHFRLYKDEKSLEDLQKRFPFIRPVHSKFVFTKEEMDASEWFRVKLLCGKVQLVNLKNTYEYSCKHRAMSEFFGYIYEHERQKDLFEAKRTVKWGRNHYFYGAEILGIPEIFCSDLACKILGNSWEGLEFWPVKYCDKEEYISDLHQMKFTEVLPTEAILFSGKEKVKKCRKCGQQKRKIKEPYQLILRKEYMPKVLQVYTTGETFEYPMHIVPNSFYQLCEKYNMNRNLEYEPIKII